MLGGKEGLGPAAKARPTKADGANRCMTTITAKRNLEYGARGTLKDIAAAVGVSPATVSLVLNDKPVRIFSERREQILNVASSMHYRTNQTARAAT